MFSILSHSFGPYEHIDASLSSSPHTQNISYELESTGKLRPLAGGRF